MVGDKFSDVIQELGTALKMKLVPDKNNACVLRYTTGLQVQIELDGAQDRVMIGSDLGELPQGRFRENVFKEALKANGLPPPRQGIFAYSKKKEGLVIFDTLSLKDLTGQKLADFLNTFIQKAELWRLTIAKGEVPSFMGNELSFGQKGALGGLFGLIK